MKSKLVKKRPLIMVLLLFSSILAFTLSSYSANGGVYPPPQGPVAGAGPDQEVKVGDEVTFDGSGSYDPDGSIASYFWDFGDEESVFIGSLETKVSSTGTGYNPTHTYTVEGTYIVTLTVTDNEGLTDTDTMTVTVVSDSKDEENTLLTLPIVAFLITIAIGVLIVFVLTRKE